MSLDLGFQIEDYVLFDNEDNYLGKAEEISLPKITRKTNDFSPGGGIGEMAVDVGVYEKMEFSFKLRDISAQMATYVGQNKIDGHSFQIRAIARNESNNSEIGIVYEIQGRINEREREALKRGENSITTLAGIATRYGEHHNGKRVRLLDIIKRIDETDGKDAHEFNRNFLGV